MYTKVMWKDAFESGKNIVVATISKGGRPHAIYVTALGFIAGKLLIGACQMKTTLENLKVCFSSRHPRNI